MNVDYQFNAKKLVSIDDLTVVDIKILYDVTLEFWKILQRPNRKVPSLKELTIANLFFEDSTRTRISFELAEKRLSADIVNFTSSASSMKKGETLLDTVRNLLAMKIDMLIVRDRHSGTPAYLSKKLGIPVINAGDGTNEHPTQSLLDLFTLWSNGLNENNSKIILVGDVLHSRVAGSSIKLWEKIGYNFEIVGPKTIVRKSWTNCTSNDNLKKTIYYTLRIQKERLNKELIPSNEEYNKYFGIAADFSADQNVYFMHPGPVNRGIEIDSQIADHSQSLILNQVEMGVAMRMAILFLLGQKKWG